MVLVKPGPFGTRPVIIGEIAHIVSDTPDGPRGQHPLPVGEHDKHTNLIFLCSLHHKEVDDQPNLYTVERLRQIKKDHEESIEKAVTQAKLKQSQDTSDLPLLNEIIHSTLLAVSHMPRLIYGAPCKYGDSQEREAAKDVVLTETPYLCPFIIRNGGTLFAFNDLRQANGPFRNIVDATKVTMSNSSGWLANPDTSKWFATLLNRTLNKLTGRKHLKLDREHNRYFFVAAEPGTEKSVRYRPLNQSFTSRKVVWRPVRKKTNEPRSFWNHLAVNLRFIYIGKEQWCFCIRPEMRVTKDGVESIESKNVGSHVTRQTAHEFNYDLLEDVNFWRDYLSGGQPRIILRFGERSAIVIPTTLMASTVQWPGIPQEFAKPFTNIDYEDDLFTSAEFYQIQTEDSEFTQVIDSEENEGNIIE